MFIRIVTAAIATITLAVLTQPALAADDRTFATIIINSENHGEVVVYLRPPDVLIRTKDLETFGLHGFAGTRLTIAADQYVSLQSLSPKISFAFNPDNVTVTVVADPSFFAPQSINLSATAPANIRYRSDPNAFVDYNLSAATHSKVSAFLEGGFNTSGLLADSTLLLSGGKLARGLSYIESADREKLRKTTLGDAVVSAGELQGTPTIAGITVQRSWEFDPYLVRIPLPTLHASVATPSTADVYVNGVLVRRIDIAPGPFVLQNIPVINGMNATAIVLRDAFGRTVNYNADYYQSAGLLRPGLSDYAFAAGTLRTGLLTPGDHYTGTVAIGRYTRGLTNWTTAGAQFQTGRGAVNAGALLNTITKQGYFHLAFAASSFAGLIGNSYTLQYALNKKTTSYGISASGSTAHYATISLHPTDDRTLLEISAFAALPIGKRNGFSIAATRSLDRDAGPRASIQVQTAFQLPRQLSLSVSATRDISASARNTDIFANLSVPLGPRTTVSTAVDLPAGGSPQTRLLLQHSNDAGPGLGYALSVARGAQSVAQSLLRYQSPYANAELVTGGQFGQAFGTQLSVSGAIVAMNRGLYFSRPLQDGFALVDASGAPHLEVLLNNQVIGRTGSRGKLLVPALLPYYGNSITLSTKSAPLNLYLKGTDQLVAPRFHSGLLVRFEALVLRALIGQVTIHTSLGEAIPEYGDLTLSKDSITFRSDLTQEGNFYLENVPSGSYEASVRYKDGVCIFHLTIPATQELRTDLGTLTCTKS